MSMKSHILQALRARLSMDRDLGGEWFSAPEGLSATLENLRLVFTEEEGNAKPIATPDIGSVPKPPSVVAKPNPPEVRKPLPQIFVAGIAQESAPVNNAKAEELEPLRREALTCTACGLCAKRNSVVWGEGSLDAEVMFIGEAPGRDEDLEGRPFVGRSGRVLTDIIEKGMKLPRGDVYIANMVKCRPPGNRDPKPEEVTACSRFLEKQIAVIRPRIIVAVGGVAGCALLDLPPKTSGLRGRWHQFQGVPMRVIYHPSYLLRQRRNDDDRTNADRATWNDIREVMARLKTAM